MLHDLEVSNRVLPADGTFQLLFIDGHRMEHDAVSISLAVIGAVNTVEWQRLAS